MNEIWTISCETFDLSLRDNQGNYALLQETVVTSIYRHHLRVKKWSHHSYNFFSSDQDNDVPVHRQHLKNVWTWCWRNGALCQGSQIFHVCEPFLIRKSDQKAAVGVVLLPTCIWRRTLSVWIEEVSTEVKVTWVMAEQCKVRNDKIHILQSPKPLHTNVTTE